MLRTNVILDADGVFLDERPYWDTAFLSALAVAGITAPPKEIARQFCDVAFKQLFLQQVTKRKGCNSNIDLSAVLAKALRQDASLRERLSRLETADDIDDIIMQWTCSAESLWRASTTDPTNVVSDPLTGFGIDRESETMQRSRTVFQQTLFALQDDDGRSSLWRLKNGEQKIVETLTTFNRELGSVRVCTGRNREETMEAMGSLSILDQFDASMVTTADDVFAAESRLGRTGLGKPSPYPVLHVAFGHEGADQMISDGCASSTTDQTFCYIGDGMADFRAVSAARSMGMPIRYCHVRSGVTNAEDEAEIQDQAMTLGVFDSLTAISTALLAGEADV
ncbi:MAG: HAD family hydrolase [Phycisphaerae bacterium]